MMKIIRSPLDRLNEAVLREEDLKCESMGINYALLKALAFNTEGLHAKDSYDLRVKNIYRQERGGITLINEIVAYHDYDYRIGKATLSNTDYFVYPEGRPWVLAYHSPASMTRHNYPRDRYVTGDLEKYKHDMTLIKLFWDA